MPQKTWYCPSLSYLSFLLYVPHALLLASPTGSSSSPYITRPGEGRCSGRPPRGYSPRRCKGPELQQSRWWGLEWRWCCVPRCPPLAAAPDDPASSSSSSSSKRWISSVFYWSKVNKNKITTEIYDTWLTLWNQVTLKTGGLALRWQVRVTELPRGTAADSPPGPGAAKVTTGTTVPPRPHNTRHRGVVVI